MDTVAVIVDSLPDRPLTTEESAIKRLDFLDEIAACEKKRGGSHILGVNYLRVVADEVGRRYDSKFNAYRNVVPSDYQGIECHSPEEIAEVVRTMFLARYPQIFDRYLETKFKTRPYGTRVTYFVGPQSEATAFNTLGVEVVATVAVSDYLRGFSVYQKDDLEANEFGATVPKQEARALSSFPAEEVPSAVAGIDLFTHDDTPTDGQEMAILQGLADESTVDAPAAVEAAPKQEFKQNKKNKKSNKNNVLSSTDSEV